MRKKIYSKYLSNNSEIKFKQLLRSCDALKIKPIMNLYTSLFAYVYSIGLYNGIVNADTQSARIANADGQEFPG